MGGSSNGAGNNILRSTAGGVPIIGDIMKGDTAQDLATAQGNAAMSQLDQQNQDRAQALKLAAPTDMELSQLDQAVSTNTTDINRKQQLLASADPAFIEAGRQALSILQGGSNSTTNSALQPIQQQRDQQRAELVNRLQSQLGPGWENSTTGQQALQAFDAQSASTLNNARMSTLSQLMGFSGQALQAGNLNNNISQSQSIAQQRGNIQGRQINAIEGTPITMAGAPFAGQIASDQYSIGQMQGASNTMGSLFSNATLGIMKAPGGGGGGGGGSTASSGGSGGAGNAGSSMMAYKGGKVPRRGYADGGMIEPNSSVMDALIHAPPPDSGGGGSGAGLGSIMSLAALAAAHGGRVPGRAVVKGDSPRNDKVNVWVSPGEVIVDRATLAKGPKAIVKFVERAKRKRA